MGSSKCGCLAQAAAKTGPECQEGKDSGKTVIYLNSDTMGRGDDKLGAKLMAVYLDTLGNFANSISHIILVNSGVKLACDGGAAREQLANLAGTGIKILSCGTCLDYFKLRDDLAVGTISNMVEIIETKLNCRKIMTP